MKGNLMAKPEWRTVQIYLSDNGVCEVEVDTSSAGLRCTCPNFDSKGTCKHVRMVNTKMKTNGGIYPVHISNRATKEETEKANESYIQFRNFVIRYGKIEVI